MRWASFFILFLGFVQPVFSLERFFWDQKHTVVGELKHHLVSPGETLLDIARSYDLGFNQIKLANPKVDPWIPPEGQKVLVPSWFVLPEKKAGIVVSLAEMRLYYFRRELRQKVVYTAPIGVGVEGKLTELGVYTVIRKKKNPAWHVPESIRQEDPTLPPVVPPGPDNPLGAFALYLSRGAYAIHGTNKPWGIGRRVSHGCIRLYPEDIEALYPLVPVGTPVFIVYQPYKLGLQGEEVFLQVFPDFEKKVSIPKLELIRLREKIESETGSQLILFWEEVDRALEEANGIPTRVGKARPGRR